MLNFTGVTFVSELDEIAFILAHWGFFGHATQAQSDEISQKVNTISGG
jgi:hypothetical protein